jgi:hypothetical protein
MATLRNKIALHENFMMVQPIAAGTQQTEVKKWRGGKRSCVEWGKIEKFNDTALTSGKLRYWRNEKRIPYKICYCVTVITWRRTVGRKGEGVVGFIES